MDDATKQTVIARVRQLLDDPTVCVQFTCAVTRTTQPGDQWETYAPGRGYRVLIEIPCMPGEAFDLPIT